MKARIKFGLLAVVAVLVIVEATVRLFGTVDFPIYEANNIVGYIPRPSQQGAFLNRNTWLFNSRSMGATEFAPKDGEDILLIGDSVVLGGNPLRQEDKLGPQLARRLGRAVWPISAGSWALRNELAYLRTNPDVIARMGRIVFVLNSGDFDEASSWSCEVTHPRSRPLLASLYLFRKYVWDFAGSCGSAPNDLQVPSGDWQVELNDFLASQPSQGKPIDFFLYPARSESSGEKPFDATIEPRLATVIDRAQGSIGRISIYDINRDPRWQRTLYRDDIHPSVEGNGILATIIASPAMTTEHRSTTTVVRKN